MVEAAVATGDWAEIKTDDGTLWYKVEPLPAPNPSGATFRLRAVSHSKDGAERLLRMKIHECFDYGDVVIARNLPRVEEVGDFAADSREWRGSARFLITSRPKPAGVVFGFGGPKP